jgi:hypothetical protein
MRAALLVLATLLSACAQLGEQAAYSVSGGSGESPEFGVSAWLGGTNVPANYAAFNASEEAVAAFHAEQICTLGYERLAERTLAFDPGRLAWWRVRCAPYRLALF